MLTVAMTLHSTFAVSIVSWHSIVVYSRCSFEDTHMLALFMMEDHLYHQQEPHVTLQVPSKPSEPSHSSNRPTLRRRRLTSPNGKSSWRLARIPTSFWGRSVELRIPPAFHLSRMSPRRDWMTCMHWWRNSPGNAPRPGLGGIVALHSSCFLLVLVARSP